MAKNDAVWGIDIGQCALKALRCRPHEKEPGKAVVEAFDYIEYPKLLSQPDADREELVREALDTFLSRNTTEGDKVVISVPGQSGLARFIKLPPVEQKKIPDIVKYEARQQIPFALEDVVWDYQPLAGGSQDDGFALETEVGLFAMKRDQIARALEPLDAAGLEVDVIQLAPLSVYNYLCFDRFDSLSSDGYDPENPPPATVVLSFGADTTDLVISNGLRVWQRNIPIGGSHFTKALTKEMRITFAKAEHLKRNATKAENPKAVFQAMRPVFSDLVGEIQRSLGFYMSNNREAELGEVIALGNPMKLPGLERYLAQNLEQPIKPIEDYKNLVGGSVTSAPQFKDNLLSFAVAYGLCVQGLEAAQLKTNLLPDEIVTDRIIRAKKPWAVIAAALLLLGFMVNHASHVASWGTADVEGEWSSPIRRSQQVTNASRQLNGDNQTLKQQYETIYTIGENLQSNANDRLLWLELLKAVDMAIPKDPRPLEERKKNATDVTLRPELHIDQMECLRLEDVATWFEGPIAEKWEDLRRSTEMMDAFAARKMAEEAAAAGEAPATAGEEGSEGLTDSAAPEQQPADDFADNTGGSEEVQSPTGPGWIVQLRGHHFYNSGPADAENKISKADEGDTFVRRTLISNLLDGTIELPDGLDEQGNPGKPIAVSLADLGISFPVVITGNQIETVQYDPNATDDQTTSRSRPSRGGRGAVSSRPSRGGRSLRASLSDTGGFGDDLPRSSRRTARNGRGAGNNLQPEKELWELRRYDFTVQFVWQPKPRQERAAAKAAEEAAAESASLGRSAAGRVAVR